MDGKRDTMNSIGLILLGLMAFLANGDNYAAAPLLLEISKDLDLTISMAALSVTAYMLAFGLFTLVFGPLSDRFGKARIIAIASFGTSVFSIAGAFANNLPTLIAFRALNGAFGAGIFPVTMALVGQSFGMQERPKALGKVMGLMFLGGASATAIGGALAFLGSWRLVYLAYGVAELFLSFVLWKVLPRDEPMTSRLDLGASYGKLLSNFRFMRIAATIFLVGFSVFGSFTYAGKLLNELGGFSVLKIGLILSLFGAGTVLGGRLLPIAKATLKNGFLVLAAILGGVSLLVVSTVANVWAIGLGLFGFGFAFIFLQTTLVSTAQEKAAHVRGTAMSLTSFNMFVGGALGTALNGRIIEHYGVPRIFSIASGVILVAGLLAAVFVARFEMRRALALAKD